MDYYVMDRTSKEVRSVKTQEEYLKGLVSLGETARHVAVTDLAKKVVVSTVFTGLNPFPSSSPNMFETAFLTNEEVKILNRYSSHAEALIGHRAEVAKLKTLLGCDDHDIQDHTVPG